MKEHKRQLLQRLHVVAGPDSARRNEAEVAGRFSWPFSSLRPSYSLNPLGKHKVQMLDEELKVRLIGFVCSRLNPLLRRRLDERLVAFARDDRGRFSKRGLLGESAQGSPILQSAPKKKKKKCIPRIDQQASRTKRRGLETAKLCQKSSNAKYRWTATS